jgi:hypothetical protein
MLNTLPDSIDAYMEELGDFNRELRGHRAWNLSPKLQKFGVGSSKSGRFNAMWIQDESGSSKLANGYYAYPAPGYFPVEYIAEKTGWSAYFPELKVPAGENVEVRVWKLSKPPENAILPGEVPENSTEVKVKYVSVVRVVCTTVNFEPDVLVKPRHRYWVSIKGGGLQAAYMVEFISK